MADHDRLRGSRGAAGVNERACMARLLRLDALLDGNGWDIVSELRSN